MLFHTYSEKPMTDNPTTVNPTSEKPTSDNPTQINKEREKELELLMKYKKDFTNAQWRFVQYWWCTPIWYKREKIYWFTKPIKIIPNPWIEKCITQRVNQQLKIYNFVKPYINEIHLNEFAPKEKQVQTNILLNLILKYLNCIRQKVFHKMY